MKKHRIEEVVLESQTLENIDTERQQIRHLLVIEDMQGWRTVSLEATTYTVGRSLTNSVVLYSRLISRQHAILLRVTTPETAGHLFRIVDGDLQGKRSTNGLLVNGQRCFSHDLKHGDLIAFGGDVKARYYAISNLSDMEFLKYCEIRDFSEFSSDSSNFFQTPAPLDSESSSSSEAALVRLASFPELIPNPILEIGLTGTITYLNPAAVRQFPGIQEARLEHPLLKGLLAKIATIQTMQEKFFIREVEIGGQVFEQSVHYISESDLVRSYLVDITQRKKAEAALRQQAQREAIINRIVQAMRRTLVPGEVLQITVNLLSEALGVNHCLIVETNPTQINSHFISGTTTGKEDLIHANYSFVQSFKEALARGDQIYLPCPEAKMVPELRFWVKQCSLQAVLITPLWYLQEYLGSISLYQCDCDNQKLTEDCPYWTTHELSLVKTIADQCAIAIHQAQLYQRVQDLNAALERQVQERTAQLQQKMQELQKMSLLKDDFLSTVSHELRSPMTNMKMAIHMLKQFPAGIQQEQYLRILENECTRETELINDLLDLQRLEAEFKPIGLETIHLQDWLPGVVELFQSRALQHQQTFRVKYSDSLPPLISDRAWLERILVELLNNACKYTPVGGKILLSVSFTNDSMPKITMTVANEAEISAAELPRVFDKFYRIPNSDPWKRGGTGLGLALVQKLVDQLQGQVSVTSQNGYTKFVVELPQIKLATR